MYRVPGDLVENKTPRYHTEYVEMCKTITKKPTEDIQKRHFEKQLRHLRAWKGQKNT